MKAWRGLIILCGLCVFITSGMMSISRQHGEPLYWLMGPISTNISENAILRLNADGSNAQEFPHQIEQFWTAV